MINNKLNNIEKSHNERIRKYIDSSKGTNNNFIKFKDSVVILYKYNKNRQITDELEIDGYSGLN